LQWLNARLSCFELISDKMGEGKLDKENVDAYWQDFENAANDVLNYAKSKGAKIPDSW
jgi:hypothetical protein